MPPVVLSARIAPSFSCARVVRADEEATVKGAVGNARVPNGAAPRGVRSRIDPPGAGLRVVRPAHVPLSESGDRPPGPSGTGPRLRTRTAQGAFDEEGILRFCGG